MANRANEALIDSWVLSLHSKSPRTQDLYVREVRRFADWLATSDSTDDLLRVGRRDAEAYIVDMREQGRAPATIRSRWIALRNFYNWCTDEDEVDVSPLAKVKVPKPDPPPPDVVPGDDLRLLFKTCEGRDFEDRRDAALLRFLVATQTDIVTRARRALDGVSGIAEVGLERISALLDDPKQVEHTAGWAVAASDPAYERAIGRLIRDPLRGHLEFTQDELLAYQRAAAINRSIVVGTDAEGGYLAPMVLDPTILLTSAGVIDPMRRVARTVTTASDNWSGITSAGVSAEWKAEAAEAADATPSDFANPTVPVHMADAYVEASIEATQDTTIVRQLSGVFADAKATHEATAFWTGSGSGQPEGVITGLDGTSSELSPATTEVFAKADVYAALEAVPARFRHNASWIANLAVFNLVRQFDTSGGVDLWVQLAAGTPPTLLGKAAYEASESDDGFDVTATADNFILTCGDFEAGYTIVDRVGASLEVIPHVFGSNNRPTAKRGFFYYWRTGGKVVRPEALRVMNIATTA